MVLSARLDDKYIKCILEALWVNNPYVYFFEKPGFIRYKGKKRIPIIGAGRRLNLLDRPYLTAYRVNDLRITPMFDDRYEIIAWTEPPHEIFDKTTMQFRLTGPPRKRTYRNRWPRPSGRGLACPATGALLAPL